MTWVYVLIGVLIVAGVKAGPGTPIPGTNQAIAAIVIIAIIVGLSKL